MSIYLVLLFYVCLKYFIRGNTVSQTGGTEKPSFVFVLFTRRHRYTNTYLLLILAQFWYTNIKNIVSIK